MTLYEIDNKKSEVNCETNPKHPKFGKCSIMGGKKRRKKRRN